MQLPDRRFRAERDDRIRADAWAGHSPAWLAVTYGLSERTIYRIVEGGATVEPPSGDPPALAAWEIRGFPAGDRPSRAWIDHLVSTSPDIDDASPCVYFMQDGEFVKIGLSARDRVKDRVAGLANANPREVTLRRLVLGGRVAELRLHAYFAHLHVRGEWFWIDSELAAVAEIPF